MTIDWTKPIQTRDGRKARLLCTDANNKDYPVVALVPGPSGKENPTCYTSEGLIWAWNESPYDLMNVPERTENFLNIYANSPGYYRKISDSKASREEADRHAELSRTHVLKITFEGSEIVDVHAEKVTSNTSG